MSKKDKIRNVLYGMEPPELTVVWNKYQSAIYKRDIIYSMQEDFDNIIGSLSPMNITQLVIKAERNCRFDTCDDYFCYDPENEEIYSFDSPEEVDSFEYEDLIDYIAASKDDMGIQSLHEILNEVE